MRTLGFEPSAAVTGRCPACGDAQPSPFFEVRGVPTNTSLLMGSAEEARKCRRGDILLGFCDACGFITNLAFDPALTEYSERCEETQGFSATFSAYARGLAEDLIERHALRGRRVIEIGCGKGEFLALVCELGGNEGIGFDPAFREERHPCPENQKVRFVREFYTERHVDLDADLYCSRMTLEHIPEVESHMRMIRRTLDARRDVVVYVQVPEAGRILDEGRFCDVLYEHCSYFAPESLRNLFHRTGFEVLDTRISFEGQHLAVEGRPTLEPPPPVELGSLSARVETFRKSCAEQLERWTRELERAFEQGHRVVVWGSGSKATAFLTMLDIREEIDAVVDINPYRQGMFMAGTGQAIVAPEALRKRPPDLVVVMNPIYRHEIRASLQEMGLSPRIATL